MELGFFIVITILACYVSIICTWVSHDCHVMLSVSQVLCGLPVYLKFAGAVVEVLKRWLQCEDTIRDDYEKESYFAQIHRTRFVSFKNI